MMRRTSITIAMNLRFYVYASEPGAFYHAYLKGLAKPVPVEYTDEERQENALKRDAAFAEWQEVDPEGYRLWHLASVAMQGGDSSFLKSAWSQGILEDHNMKVADPCAYCASCRKRPPYRD